MVINMEQKEPLRQNTDRLYKDDQDRGEYKQSFTKLPDAEFEVMSAVWKNAPPVTTTLLMNQIGHDKGWKLQTLIALLNRLTERGFIRSEKLGKERSYYPCINNKEYIQYETKLFLERYHNNSLAGLMSAFSGNNKLSKEEINELNEWLKKMEEE